MGNSNVRMAWRWLAAAVGPIAAAASGCSSDTSAEFPPVVVSVDGSAEADAAMPDAEAGPCGPLQKLCGQACVGLGAPSTGCGQPGCEPCELPHAQAGCSPQGACAIASCSAGFADCDKLAASGCESEVLADALNCGACGAACAIPHASAKCEQGACKLAACNPGFADCNADSKDGCEVPLDTSLPHCGSCQHPCKAPGAQLACVKGMCVVDSCDAGRADCDGDPDNGCEIDVTTSAEHCGACDKACAPPHGQPACVAGSCGIASCDPGWDDCNGDGGDGCEAPLATDFSNCGVCGLACQLPNAAAACAAGACVLTSCVTGFADCNASQSDGCESDLLEGAMSCGACGLSCSFPQAAGLCKAGTCQMGPCSPGWGDCDAMAGNGCESDLATALQHCGGCGLVCAPAHASGTCSAFSCQVAACEPGYADCNTAAADGCEVDATSDTGNCGGCGLVCNLPHAVQSCQGGACKVGQCTAGWGNCDGYHANGCEAFLLSDPSHCGACNNVCSFAHASSLCLSGSCSMGACSAGWADCDGSSSTGCEAQLATDLNHCGACNAACAPPHATGACTAGSCKLGACAPGYSDCNGVLADGCEVATASDPEHCGGCGLACNLPHAAAMCQSGACKVQACQPGYGDCDAVATNGCEATLASDPSHCGACQSACALPHAASLCSAGSCQVASCQAGWANCDGLAANGCEISTASNPAHCGACGHSCQGGSCLNGACQPVALVTGQQNPWSIAVDGQFVYWDNRVASGAVLKVPLTGGGFLTLAAEQPEPEGLALDAQYVYWANFAGGTIMRLALAGGVPTVVASGQSGPAGITAWGGTVFWTNWNGNSVMRVVPGNAPSPLATGQSSPHRIATDGSSVWWTNWAGNTVRRVDALGGTAVTVASSGQPLGVTLDSGWVYWTDASSILRAPIEGGPVTTLATGQDHPSGIVVDADNVYFTCHAPGGSVRRVLKTGGPVITLAAAQNLPVYLATDATSLYWTNSGSGTVMKLAK